MREIYLWLLCHCHWYSQSCYALPGCVLCPSHIYPCCVGTFPRHPTSPISNQINTYMSHVSHESTNKHLLHLTNSMNTFNSNNNKKKSVVNVIVEAMVHPSCPVEFNVLREELRTYLVKYMGSIYHEGPVDLSSATPILQQGILQCDVTFDGWFVSSLSTLDESDHSTNYEYGIDADQVSHIMIYMYTLNEEPPEPEEIDEPGNQDSDPITVCETTALPHMSLHTSWEHLIFPKTLKRNLLSYANTALLFSNKKVSSHIINWNRVLMLYGVPGTGKTTLCRALAHKLSIQTQHIFSSGGYLLEIKSHSLFSKWFSESGKLIARLFDRIRELVEDEPDALFCVLIDEVESLAGSRTASTKSGSEPSDAVRAVNSLLTSLDSIRQYRNVLILTTTNLTDCVDSAFVDRVDWMVKIDLPNEHARYEILRGCIMELKTKGILIMEEGHDDRSENEWYMCDYNSALEQEISQNIEREEQYMYQNMEREKENCNSTPSIHLLQCARLAEGLSGRSLRKLPFQSYAFHIGTMQNPSVMDFMEALRSSISMKVCGDI
jgi:pachytene checkpoint protein 2